MKHAFPSLAVGALLALAGTLAVSQSPVAPPPKPPDSGPTLAATLQFIQDKLNAQGRVGYVLTYSNFPGWTDRRHFLISDVSGEPTSCILFSTVVIESDSAMEATIDSTGQSIPGNQIHSVGTVTTMIPLCGGNKSPF